MNWGVPFTERPKALRYDYKVKCPVRKSYPVDRLQQERSGGRAGLCDNCFLFAKAYGGR